MRQRQRSIPFGTKGNLLGQRLQVEPAGPDEYFTVQSSPALPMLAQRFIDAGKGRKHPLNECFNTRVEYGIGGSLPSFGSIGEERDTEYTTYGEDATGFNVSVPTHTILSRVMSNIPRIGTLPDWRRAVKAARHAQWVREGWRAPKLTLYSGFSLPNFLFEWNQMTGLVRSWAKRDELIARWHKFRGRNARLATGLQQAANERLAHVYGTDLLISDARFLFETLTRINEKVDNFLKNCNRVMRLYKRNPQVVTFNIGGQTWPWNEFGAPGGLLSLHGQVTVRSRACLYYVAVPPEFSQFWTRVRQLCDAYGMRLDAGIPWDAIKYSFVVDWFYNVSDYLHNNYSRNNWQVEVTYLAFCNSVRLEYSETLDWYRSIWRPGNPGIDYQWTNLLTKKSIIYRRSLGEIPEIGNMQLAPKSGPWKVSRAINALALAAQKAHLPARKMSKTFFGYTD